jgi:guanosine-3',5'-bis(diphosphate) 3'-pyrophosphohydrolase
VLQPEASYRPLLDAIAFAARAHRHQLRKDDRTPYVSHVFRVCIVLRHVFGIDDPATLTAAVLHDTIEDTPTDYDDLHERFGAEVAGWVALLTKDMRQEHDAREVAYVEALRSAPWQVKACKLADLFDNLHDSAHLEAGQRGKTVRKARAVLRGLDTPDLPEKVRRAWEMVDGLVEKGGKEATRKNR